MDAIGAETAVQASYFVAAALFIFGLKRMSSPVTARSGIVWAGAGMAVATLVSFLYPGMSNFELIIADNAYVFGNLLGDTAAGRSVKQLHEDVARHFDSVYSATWAGVSR